MFEKSKNVHEFSKSSCIKNVKQIEQMFTKILLVKQQSMAMAFRDYDFFLPLQRTGLFAS